MTGMSGGDVRLRDTRVAFDSVAATYDGPLGNNTVVQGMRGRMWRTIEDRLPPGARLLDLGCGAGIDAVHFASEGYRVLATDWSPRMVETTRLRIDRDGVEAKVEVRVLGMQELATLRGERFDAIYSDLGAINCAPDVRDVAEACTALLNPGGIVVLSVIGRVCPWEVAYYGCHGNWGRAFLRESRGVVPVPLNGETVWTRYYTPGKLARAFAPAFKVQSVRGMGVVTPPPYLEHVWERFPRTCAMAAWLEERIGSWPVIRSVGDHFLMVLSGTSSH